MKIYTKIPGYEDYSISEIGEILSTKFNKIKRKSTPICNGRYRMVRLFKDGKSSTISVHQLMAITFLGHNLYNGLIVDHKNNIKTDNRLDNLRLITQRENVFTHHKGVSQHKGVCWRKSAGKWSSRIWDGEKRRFLGLFENEYDAHLAYEKELSTILLK